MSNKDNFTATVEKVRQIYTFLTEKEPTPDDEIEAREELIGHFKNLISINKDPKNSEMISEIFDDLNEWDTLDLWFSETKLPSKMAQLLSLPEPSIESLDTNIASKSEPSKGNEIDLTEIFNKVSEQFQGEIESLKGKIDDLKKQLEQKDEKLKTITEKKKVQKIRPKREVKLAPPKIKIPILKKTVQPSDSKPKTIPSNSRIENIPKEPPTPKEFLKPSVKVDKENLSPIPAEKENKVPEPETEKLAPIPKSKPLIEPIIIEESRDIPIITEKRKIIPIISEKQSKAVEESKEKTSPFLVEKPKISSVRIEEIEHESMKSTSSDLFNVFSSIGSKPSETPEEKPNMPQKNLNERIENNRPKKIEISSEPKTTRSFIIFNNVPSNNQIKESTSQEELSTDKDSLYQELIALEGKRYAIEKSYKDLDRNYGKGSIADNAYKVQSEKLQIQLDEITSRINSIRRLISSL